MPPERPISPTCGSVRLREFGERTCAFEWLATRGAAESAATSQKPRSFRCARSIRTPSLLHSAVEPEATVQAGVDVGGTFTDAVLLTDENELRTGAEKLVPSKLE